MKKLLFMVLVLALWPASPAAAQERSPTEQQYDDGQAMEQQQADLDCADFDSQEEAQREFEEDPSDPNRLDADDDGEACETFDYGDGGTGGGGGTPIKSGEGSLRGLAEFRCEEILEITRSADRNQYSFSYERVQECLAREVIDDPKGVLAKTGGPPLAVLVAVGFLAAGVALLRRI